MKTEQFKMMLVYTGAILFNIIFWQEKLAINALLFDVFVLASVFYLYSSSLKSATLKWLLIAHIITAATVILHNTLLSKLAFSATMLLVVVFVQYMHRSVWYAAGSAITNYLMVIPSLFSAAGTVSIKTAGVRRFRKAIRFLIIPLLIAGLFLLLYSFANVMFDHVMKDISVAMQSFFLNFFSWFNWQRSGFLVLGLFVTGGLLLRSRSAYFSKKDMQYNNELVRKKRDFRRWKESVGYDLLNLFIGKLANGTMGLRNENTIGIISLTLLNLLLLCINCLDIIYVWFGFSYTPDKNLTQYVHEGTGMLIFSILLAMIVLLFFFRGNLNFYKKNKWLKYGAYCWIAQNAILVVSVWIRDSYYIQHMGLAYKRIGVLVFLLMVLMGLSTMFLKIWQCKSNYYLLRVNGWFAIILLVAGSCIHWDEQIASYNLARKQTIPVDVKFLLTLSDKALPLIEQNQDILATSATISNSEGKYLYRSALTPAQLFDIRKRDFFEEQQHYSWLSWNMADSYVKQQLSGKALSVLK